MRKFTFLLAWLVLSILAPFSIANAAIETIGPFNGQLSEGFETQEGPYVTELSVFCGLGTVRNLDDGPYLHITGYWTAVGVVSYRSGICFMGSTRDGVEWIFDIPAGRFGGYFTTLNITPNSEGAVANFYDVADNLLAQKEVNAPYSEWTWNGWVSDVPIKRVEIIGFGSPDWLGAGGFVMHDDMEYTPFGEPGLIHYVDADATGANDGSSWADAYNYLQDALFNALPGTEIRVAEGVYKPHLNSYSLAPVSRADTFQLKSCVTIKGGYAGFGETDPDARDISLYETVLSGDLNGDDVAVNDPCDLPSEPTKAENSYHVVTGTGTDETAILDGFTITGGNANGPHDPYRFEYGGGMYCNLYSSPTVINCTFRGNMAVGGGGLYIYWDNNMMLTNCAFIGNYAGNGGGMEAMRSRANLTNCVFSGNAARNGGGMSNQDGGPTLTNCTFSANSAAGSGGGIDNFSSSPTLINCTLTGNSAEYGGAINSFLECTTVVTNSILWANTAAQGSQICLEEDPHYSSDASISYCNIEGGITGVYVGGGCRLNWGEGNIDADPCFVEPGYWDADGAWVEGDYHLLMDSVCINAGDPNYVAGPNETDLDGRDRVICGRIDMGAYEFHCPKIVYVDADATGNNDGSSWADAYNLLQDGLAAACEGDEIWVAQGVYKPDQGGGNMSGSREATFQLKNGVTIKGSYAGFGEPDPNARDIELYETILSGDLNGDDGPNFSINGDNSYQVVTAISVGSTAVLDGLIITAGNANHPHYLSMKISGGGMYMLYSSPTIINCIFTSNSAAYSGAGLSNYKGNPILTNCTFHSNLATSHRHYGGSGYGAGMYNSTGSPILTKCIFSNNHAKGRYPEDFGGIGGGLFCYVQTSNDMDKGPTLIDCIFNDNTAQSKAGGIYPGIGNTILINCIFTRNYAESGGAMASAPRMMANCLLFANSAEYGGAMYLGEDKKNLIINCTFVANSATFIGGIVDSEDSIANLTNCILWNNTSSGVADEQAQIYLPDGTPILKYNCIQGWTGDLGGTGNIGEYPLFVDQNNHDYQLLPSSPCVDTGDNDSVPPDVCDLEGNARIYDGDGDGEAVVDMGAYELSMLPLEVPMKIVPQALNPGSHGKWIKAHFVLPEVYTIEDVDTSRPAEFEQFQLTSESMEVFVNKEDLVEVIAAFDRSVFCGIGPFEGEIAVVGYLRSGRRFRGTDTIKIVTNKIKHLAVVASNWLSVCSAPDWCSGADLDQDSEVNLVDFALLDGCCFEVIED